MTELEKAIRELEDGYILGAKLSPHEKDIFREGFLYALKPEHMKLTEEVKGLIEALKFYAGRSEWKDAKSEWDKAKLLSFDKFGALDADISGPYIADQALKPFEKGQDEV